MSQPDAIHRLAEFAGRFFTDNTADRDEAKRSGMSQGLWSRLSTDIPSLVSGDEHVADGTLVALLRLSGRHAVALPLAETYIAERVLRAAGLAVPEGLVTVALPHAQAGLRLQKKGGGWLLAGQADRVPWARLAQCIVTFAKGPGGAAMVACVPAARCRISDGRNLAHESRDRVEFDCAVQAAPVPAGVDEHVAFAQGALCRSVQIGGAMEYALDLSVQHARERRQFGKRIGEFQSIQHELARFAGDTAACMAAALSAAGAMQTAGIVAAQPAVAAAKIRAAEAAREGALIAHQVLGAIGLTDQHALHHATLRLWAWREEYGNEVYWADYLGRMALEGTPGHIAVDGSDYWTTLVDRDDAYLNDLEKR